MKKNPQKNPNIIPDTSGSITDDNFTAKELANLYNLDLYQNISCEEDAMERELEYMNVWNA